MEYMQSESQSTEFMFKITCSAGESDRRVVVSPPWPCWPMAKLEGDFGGDKK